MAPAAFDMDGSQSPLPPAQCTASAQEDARKKYLKAKQAILTMSFGNEEHNKEIMHIDSLTGTAPERQETGSDTSMNRCEEALERLQQSQEQLKKLLDSKCSNRIQPRSPAVGGPVMQSRSQSSKSTSSNKTSLGADGYSAGRKIVSPTRGPKLVKLSDADWSSAVVETILPSSPAKVKDRTLITTNKASKENVNPKVTYSTQKNPPKSNTLGKKPKVPYIPQNQKGQVKNVVPPTTTAKLKKVVNDNENGVVINFNKKPDPPTASAAAGDRVSLGLKQSLKTTLSNTKDCILPKAETKKPKVNAKTTKPKALSKDTKLLKLPSNKDKRVATQSRVNPSSSAKVNSLPTTETEQRMVNAKSAPTVEKISPYKTTKQNKMGAEKPKVGKVAQVRNSLVKDTKSRKVIITLSTEKSKNMADVNRSSPVIKSKVPSTPLADRTPLSRNHSGSSLKSTRSYTPSSRSSGRDSTTPPVTSKMSKVDRTSPVASSSKVVSSTPLASTIPLSCNRSCNSSVSSTRSYTPISTCSVSHASTPPLTPKVSIPKGKLIKSTKMPVAKNSKVDCIDACERQVLSPSMSKTRNNATDIKPMKAGMKADQKLMPDINDIKVVKKRVVTDDKRVLASHRRGMIAASKTTEVPSLPIIDNNAPLVNPSLPFNVPHKPRRKLEQPKFPTLAEHKPLIMSNTVHPKKPASPTLKKHGLRSPKQAALLPARQLKSPEEPDDTQKNHIMLRRTSPLLDPLPTRNSASLFVQKENDKKKSQKYKYF